MTDQLKQLVGCFNDRSTQSTVCLPVHSLANSIIGWLLTDWPADWPATWLIHSTAGEFLTPQAATERVLEKFFLLPLEITQVAEFSRETRDSRCRKCGHENIERIGYWQRVPGAEGEFSRKSVKKGELEAKTAATVVLINSTPWPESSSERYRPSDCRLLAKLVPTFVDRGVLRSQHGGSPTAVTSVFWTGADTFLSK
jgi:hypothetical protein